MPYLITGDPSNSGKTSVDFRGMNFDYEYPNGLNLKPDSDLHKKLRDRIWRRAHESRTEMSKRYPSWREIDKTMTVYIPLKDKEKALKEKDPTKPISIVLPYTYTVHDSLMTYMSLAFFQDPMFRYEGVEDSDTIGAMLKELVIKMHCIKSKVPLAVHTIISDNFKYGVGVGIPGWIKRHGRVPIKSQSITESVLGPQTENHITFVDKLIYEGNDLTNIDPYMWLPDTSYSSDKIQDSEYQGWLDKDNYMNMLSAENASDGRMFNVKYLQELKNKRSSLSIDQSDRDKKFGRSAKTARGGSDTTNPIDNIKMYINLIPKEWGLSGSENPEKWFFVLSADEVITEAYRADHNHGMYPLAVASSEYDGYSTTPISRMELLSGSQDVLNFLFNCYDDKTEVLTEVGWINLAKAKEANLNISTVDPKNGSMWFEEAKQWFEYDYDGKLNIFESNRYNLAVTPNHNMFGRYRNSTETEFRPANSLHDRSKWDEFKIPMAVQFIGSQLDYIEIPPVKRKGNTGRLPRQHSVKINPDIIPGFLGWLLSDGSISIGKNSGTYTISIKQVKEQYFTEIDHYTKNLPFHVNKYFNKKQSSWQWSITDKGFYKWVKDNCYHGGTTGEFKEVPDFIRNADRFTLDRFFKSFIHGDGHEVVDHKNLIIIGTESKQLADDLQEIAIKLGYSCSIRNTCTSQGKPFWSLNVNKNAPWATIADRNSSEVYYKGKVYCFENSTHLTVVRRNGKVSICGQSHISNVRKAVNDMFVVDPYLININDVTRPGAGKIIRMRKPAWGHGVKGAIEQLGVQDITRANIGDASYMTQWMDKISGADGSMQGSLRQGGPERLTKGEFQGTRGSAISRLQRVAMIVGMQFMQDIGTMFAVHTQQRMTQESYVNIVGPYEQQLRKQFGKEANKIKVSSYDLAVATDLIVRDGSIPGGNFSDAWMQMFSVIGNSPELMQQFDITKIFTYIAGQLGAKNVEDFKRNVNSIQTQVMPDDQVANQVQAGNLVPAPGA